jgi:hypothetical protein
VILGIFLIGLQQVVIDVVHAHLGPSAVESERLQFLHPQRARRILRQRLIDTYRDLLARCHFTRHQMRADQLVCGLERHNPSPHGRRTLGRSNM